MKTLKHFTVRSFIVLMITLTLISIVPVQAQSGGTLSGTVDNASGCLVIVSGLAYAPYDAIVFHVPATGSYTFSLGSVAIPAANFEVDIFLGSFDPTQLGSSQALIGSRLISAGPYTLNLTADTTYVMVAIPTTTYGSLTACQNRPSTMGGDYTINVSGPVILGPFSPQPPRLPGGPPVVEKPVVCFEDSRVNKNCAAPIAVYVDGDIEVLRIVNDAGLPLAYLSGGEVDALDEVQFDDLSITRLEDGSYLAQIMTANGKLYWLNCSATGTWLDEGEVEF